VPEDCQRLLASVLNDLPRYNYADVIALDGTPFCTSIPIVRPHNSADRRYFQQALKTGGFVVDEYAIGRISGEPTLHLAKPYRNRNGVIAGVVAVGLSLKWLGEQIDQLDMPPGSVVSVSDRNGVFLARRPGGIRFVGQSAPADRRYLLEGDQVRVIHTSSLDNSQSLVAAVSPPAVEPKGFMVGVAVDEKLSFAAVTEANLTGLTLIISGAVMALALTVLVGSRLVRRPVRALIDVAEHWSSGDFAARTGLPADGSEFGRLAVAFEAMAATVQARERALHSALESTTDMVLVVDRDWRLSYLNQRARQRTGGADPTGAVIWDLYPELVGTPFEKGYRTAMRSGVPTKIEAQYARLGGFFEANAFPSVDGLTVFFRDLTEERRVAAALRESESRLQLAKEAAGFGVWDQNFVTGTLIWSAEQWQLHGMEARPGGPDLEGWVDCLHPEDRDRMVAARYLAMTDPARPFNGEYRVVWPDGSIHWLQAQAHVTQTASGEVLRTVGLTMEVTASREIEAALRRSSSQLEARVREEVAAREIAQARAAQAERLQALGQLAGGIAHDINNVLQAVGGAITLIQRRSNDEAAIRRFAGLATEAIERGASITRRLLTFGRRGDLRAETLDMASLIRSLQEILAYTLGAAIEVQVTLPDGLPPIVADKGQLETVLINLATNGRDAMPLGGRLLISAEPETIIAQDQPHPAGLAAGDYVRIVVADTGTGMDAATLAQAREPFFTTKKPGAGTGLGLPMAYGFAEQSGGGLSIDSRPGEGTTVSLWLPVAGDAPRADRDDGMRAMVAGVSARILVVDDEDMIRLVLARHLEDAGYDVLLAANGTEALGLLAAGEAVDGLITDLSMPGMDGIAVIRAVQSRYPGAPAILLTGYPEDAAALALNGELAGSVALLCKPVSDGQLLDRLGAMLAKRAALAS
jgi:signal transduction histidine kinase/ActR/RegA family two-component response regulator/HAMP domain-containing protein